MRARFMRYVASATGISIVQQFIGLARQALIAAFFGLTRAFDSYLVVLAVATILVFSLATVFDTVAVPRLVQVRERDGHAAFSALSNRLLLLSLAAAGLFAAGLYILVWLALPIIAAGFDAAERQQVMALAPYFLPWVLVVVPYYALSAHLKALWGFNWVFAAEILVMLVSIAVLVATHQGVWCLPLAYAAGYGCAALLLAARRGFDAAEPPGRPLTLPNDMAHQYLANQVGSAAGFVDRFFQSFLQAGGISALGYAGQIVNNLSSLLTFREIYIVPLSSEAGRTEKLERILKGIVLFSLPGAIFIVAYAEPIIAVLFQRGHFTAEAAAVTSSVLRIQAISLVFSSALAPLERMFQILGRISLTHVRNIALIVTNVVLQYLLVFRFHLDVLGVAWAWVGGSLAILLLVGALVRRCGISIHWSSVLRYALFSLLTAAVAAALARLASAHFAGVAALIVGGPIYALVVGTGLFAIRGRLRAIVG